MQLSSKLEEKSVRASGTMTRQFRRPSPQAPMFSRRASPPSPLRRPAQKMETQTSTHEFSKKKKTNAVFMQSGTSNRHPAREGTESESKSTLLTCAQRFATASSRVETAFSLSSKTVGGGCNSSSCGSKPSLSIFSTIPGVQCTSVLLMLCQPHRQIVLRTHQPAGGILAPISSHGGLWVV